MKSNLQYKPLAAGQEYFLACALRCKFKTILDVGMGSSPYIVNTLIQNNRIVTSIDIKKLNQYEHKNFIFIEGNFLDYPFEELSFDAIIASHVLEHNRNVGFFLDKVYKILNKDGIFFCLVPPHKTAIVGGHVITGWNIGILMYNLILSKFDVKCGRFKKKGYNIAAFVKKSDKELPNNLICDKGDIEKLAEYWPDKNNFKQNFEGDIPEWNWFKE